MEVDLFVLLNWRNRHYTHPTIVTQRSSNTYSCCASLMVNVRLASEPTTNSKPNSPGTVVMKEIVPSGFLRLATSLFHSPKSKIVEAGDVLTVISPSDHWHSVWRAWHSHSPR